MEPKLDSSSVIDCWLFQWTEEKPQAIQKLQNIFPKVTVKILIILNIPKMKREMKVCTYKKVQLDCYVIKGLTLKRIRALKEIDNVALPLIFMVMGENDIRSNVDSTLLVTSYLPQFDYHNSYHVQCNLILAF